jgi:hypothetical protein
MVHTPYKGVIFLFLIKHHTVKLYKKQEVQLYTFIILSLDGTLVPSGGGGESLSLLGNCIESQFPIYPVPSQYNDCAIQCENT